MRQGFCTGGDSMIFVPVETVAGNRCRVACIAVIHSQVQRHHTVAAARVRERMHRSNGRGFRIGCAVPSKAVTSNRCRIARVAVSHRQMQRHNTIAA